MGSFWDKAKRAWSAVGSALDLQQLLALFGLWQLVGVAFGGGAGAVVAFMSQFPPWGIALAAAVGVGIGLFIVNELTSRRVQARVQRQSGVSAAALEDKRETEPKVTPGPAAVPRIKLGDATIRQLSISTAGGLSEHAVVMATVSFYNAPAEGTPDAAPHNVRAEVTVFSERFEVLTKDHEGSWIVLTEVTGITALDPSDSQRSAVLPSGGEQRELGLVLQSPKNPVHFFAAAAFAPSGSLHHSFELNSERLFVRVRVFAEGVDAGEYWFHITQDNNDTMQIAKIVQTDAAFSVDSEVRDGWLHLVVSNPVDTREFEARAETLRRDFVDYATTPWWVKWRGKTDEVARQVVTQAELDFIRYELPVNDAERSIVPGVLHCYSTSMPNEGFQITPGRPTYKSGTIAEINVFDAQDPVLFVVKVSSVEPKEVVIRTILVGFTKSHTLDGALLYTLSARFLEDAMGTT